MSEYVKISKLFKNYGSLCAVDNLNLTVDKGEIFGLLGPNGAGKSTTIHIMTTLAAQDKGTVTIDGLDTVKDIRQVKKLIGVVPRDIALSPFLTALENTKYFASLYGLKGKELRRAAERALEFVGLADKADTRMNRMSGGMKRRLNIACGTKSELVSLVTDRKRYVMKVTVPSGFAREDFRKSLKALPDVQDVSFADEGSKMSIKVDTSLEFHDLMQLMDTVKQYRLEVSAVNSQVPDLDTLFLALTGKEIR